MVSVLYFVPYYVYNANFCYSYINKTESRTTLKNSYFILFTFKRNRTIMKLYKDYNKHKSDLCFGGSIYES